MHKTAGMATSNFVDYVKIFCRSGNGGAGSCHFFRSKKNPKGGPDGGNGGRGGHIILQGNAQLWTLLHLKYTKHILAENGGNGGENRSTGANGKDIFVQVPLGTIVRDAETGQIEAEVTQDGEQVILMQGGRGGKGNDFFKSATLQAPKFAQPGEEGIEAWKILELKVLADVGLVGFPNAGKSTLLSVVSAAKPEIANYPFTTLVPNLGMVNYRDGKSFVMADIPGIIEGAAEGKGLGLRFLRHIERNSILLFMASLEDSQKSIEKQYEVLLDELKRYNPELLDKQRILAVTKCDLLSESELEKEKKRLQKKLPQGLPFVFISSVANTGIEALKDMLWQALNA